jgi:hypothetical protein
VARCSNEIPGPRHRDALTDLNTSPESFGLEYPGLMLVGHQADSGL